MSTETVYLLLPEIILVLFATAIYLGGAFTSARDGWSWLAIAGLALAGAALYQQHHYEGVQAALTPGGVGVISGPIVIDLFSYTLRWLALATGFVFVMTSNPISKTNLGPEYVGSLVLIIVGLMLISASSDLVMTFLGLELVSIPTYVVLYIGRNDQASQEAATKYFFLSVLSSSLLLYGLSFLYGASGSTQITEICQALLAATGPNKDTSPLVLFALVLVVAGLCFRLTAVPFHFYAPDVYQGTSNPNAGVLAVIPKIAGLAALVRLAVVGMPGMERIGWQLALALAILTMTVGNLVALWQNNIRRLLAYSSIAHAGYMLIGLAVSFAAAGGATSAANYDGVGSTLFYLMVYALATAGSFAALSYLSGPTKQVDGLDELAGIGLSHPRTAFALAVFMFSLTGLPPLAGFWGKFSLLSGALSIDAPSLTQEAGPLRPWFIALAVAGVVNAAISAAYYLRVISVMYFRAPLTSPSAQGGAGPAAATFVCAVLVIGAGLNPGLLMEHSNQASHSARTAFQPAPAKPTGLALDVAAPAAANNLNSNP